MSQFFSKYQGGGPSAVPPGFMQAAAQSGQSIAAGIEKFGEGIANYRKNKREKRQAEAIFEDLVSREDPDIVNFSVDPKRLQKLQDGKGTTEDYLVAANSIKSKIEEINQNKKDMEDARRFDVQQAGIMERFEKERADREKSFNLSLQKFAKAESVEKANVKALSTLLTDKNVFDNDRYGAALTNFSSSPQEISRLMDLTDEEREREFTRPQTASEKAQEALNTPNISAATADRIVKFAQDKVGDDSIYYTTDPVTGHRAMVSRETGAFLGTGYDPAIAGPPKPTQSELNRKYQIEKEKRGDAKATIKEYKKLEREEANAKAKLASLDEGYEDEEYATAKALVEVISKQKKEMAKRLGITDKTESSPDEDTEILDYVPAEDALIPSGN
ncbi:MAG: hypothetical protein CMC15_16785 [Flavobacteriaceae bacterium]|nr:hypothetical protein [Flavobacteriaceae bacterium]